MNSAIPDKEKILSMLAGEVPTAVRESLAMLGIPESPTSETDIKPLCQLLTWLTESDAILEPSRAGFLHGLEIGTEKWRSIYTLSTEANTLQQALKRLRSAIEALESHRCQFAQGSHITTLIGDVRATSRYKHRSD